MAESWSGWTGTEGVPPRAQEWDLAEQVAATFMRDHLLQSDAIATPGSGDSGIDVVCRQAVAQVKWHTNSVGRPDVQRLVGAGADHPGVALAFFSRSGYSQGAIEYADRHNVSLFSYDASQSRLFVPMNRAAVRWLSAAEQSVRQEAAAKEHEERALKAKATASAAAATAARVQARIAQERLKSQRYERKQARRAEKAAQEAERAQARAESGVAPAGQAQESGQSHGQPQQPAPRLQRVPGVGGLVLGIVGCVIPLGVLSVLAWRSARRSRIDLTERGTSRSPLILRATALVAVIGAWLSLIVLASLVTEPFEDRSEGELSTAGGIAVTIALVGGGILAWWMFRQWQRFKANGPTSS